MAAVEPGASWSPRPRSPRPAGCCPRGHILLVDASCLGQPGGTGDDWRLHPAYDCTTGRLGQVQVTDWRGVNIWGATSGRLRRCGGPGRVSPEVALALRQQADVVLRIHPATFPWKRTRGSRSRFLRWLRNGARRTGLARLVSLARPALSGPAHCRPARSGHCAGAAPQAPQMRKAGRTTGPTLPAGWLLRYFTLSAATWSPTDVLYLYRARWQVELVFKKMKQLLCLNQIRSKHRTSVEATVWALLIAWALHEDTTTLLRTLLSAHTPPEMSVEQLAAQRARLDTLRSSAG